LRNAGFEVDAADVRRIRQLPAGAAYNEAFIIWRQMRLSSSDQNLPGLMQAFAEANGAHNWSSLGSFGPAEQESR
jgi:hypothetical protein